MSRDYYNRRIGINGERPRLGIVEAAGQIARAYGFMEDNAYLQRSFGYFCVDARDVAGRDGYGLRDPFYLATGIKFEGNLDAAIKSADEVVLFTLLEFVHDHVAKPIPDSGWFHSFSSCGWHYGSGAQFDDAAGRDEWRAKVNPILKHYEAGYQLSEDGEIVHLAPDGLSPLLSAQLPSKTTVADRDKIVAAVRIFQLGRSSRADRKQAIRELIDVLEFHRREVKEHLLRNDEKALFDIANNYAIRHYNEFQKDDYDENFITWLFYHFLATVHLMQGIVTGQRAFADPPPVSSRSSTNPPEPDDIPF